MEFQVTVFRETTVACLARLQPPVSPDYSRLSRDTTAACLARLQPLVSRDYSRLSRSSAAIAESERSVHIA